MKRNYPVITLNVAALATEATAAAIAYPAAANLFGDFPAAVAMTSASLIIYGGWYIAANQTDTEKRVVGAVVALLFSVATVVGIHSSAQLATSTAATTAATTADNLYTTQETQRIVSLAAAEKERAATSKEKESARWDSLNVQVEELQKPTPRQATASQITQGAGEPSPFYQWGIAAVFAILSPALLLLSALFTRQQPVNRAVDAVDGACTTASTQQKQQSSTLSVDTVDAPSTTPPTASTTPVGQSDTSVGDVLSLLSTRFVPVNGDGNITVNSLRDMTDCTERQAREAIRLAVKNGWLIKNGEGNATRHTYPRMALRAVK